MVPAPNPNSTPLVQTSVAATAAVVNADGFTIQCLKPETVKVKRAFRSFRDWVGKQGNPIVDQLSADATKAKQERGQPAALELLEKFIGKADQFSEREDLPGDMETKLRDRTAKIRQALEGAGQVCGATSVLPSNTEFLYRIRISVLPRFYPL